VDVETVGFATQFSYVVTRCQTWQSDNQFF